MRGLYGLVDYIDGIFLEQFIRIFGIEICHLDVIDSMSFTVNPVVKTFGIILASPNTENDKTLASCSEKKILSMPLVKNVIHIFPIDENRKEANEVGRLNT